ncbi:MAG: glycosyltransferase family 8 protein [Ruminococcaceae bacterium]|nr:glycosyltransferase family 8 protein [Oscillospiraceae bacterium]
MSSKILYALYTCDENYAPYAGISMNSLFENNRELEHICVYLVEDSVSEENKKRFIDQAEKYGREIIIVDAAPIIEQIKQLGIPTYRGSYTANCRLFFDTFISSDVKRLLYVDCDTLVVSSLAELFDIDMNGKAVGVVRDSLTDEYKMLIGFDTEDDYFNSGMLLIDVDRWKEQNVTSALFDYAKNVRSRYCNPDQDLLNIVLKDTKYILPPEYNFQPSHRSFSDKAYFSAYRHREYYSTDELENARRNPKILHAYRFLGDFPWHEGNLHPDTEIFDRYMSNSPWKDYEKKPAGRGMIFTVEKWMYRLLPKGLFLKIFAAITLRSFRKQNAQLLKDEAEK